MKENNTQGSKFLINQFFLHFVFWFLVQRTEGRCQKYFLDCFVCYLSENLFSLVEDEYSIFPDVTDWKEFSNFSLISLIGGSPVSGDGSRRIQCSCTFAPILKASVICCVVVLFPHHVKWLGRFFHAKRKRKVLIPWLRQFQNVLKSLDKGQVETFCSCQEGTGHPVMSPGAIESLCLVPHEV